MNRAKSAKTPEHKKKNTRQTYNQNTLWDTPQNFFRSFFFAAASFLFYSRRNKYIENGIILAQQYIYRFGFGIKPKNKFFRTQSGCMKKICGLCTDKNFKKIIPTTTATKINWLKCLLRVNKRKSFFNLFIIFHFIEIERIHTERFVIVIISCKTEANEKKKKNKERRKIRNNLIVRKKENWLFTTNSHYWRYTRKQHVIATKFKSKLKRWHAQAKHSFFSFETKKKWKSKEK